MFFSRGKEQPPGATGSSSSSASTTTTGSGVPMVAQVDEAKWQARGAAGLGAISSLSPECTPLKHRYDSCFNLWFKDYLAIGDGQIREQQRQGEASASGSGTAQPATSNNGKKRSSWFSDASSSSSGSTRASSIAESDVESSKRAIMERYDRNCGKLFQEYQACVRRAVAERGLDDLIRQARRENPFPFDHERQSDPRPNNPPFPFPAAKD